MIRKPAVAGQFYAASERSLRHEVESLIDKDVPKEDAIGVVSPHAGYVYSGAVAGAVLSTLTPKPVYIILGPNHTGLGAQFSVSSAGSWKTPLGEVAVDTTFRDRLKNDYDLVTLDETAHVYEHSVEVQLPFLQVLQKDFKFLPVIIAHAPSGSYKEFGKALAASIKKAGVRMTIIASSDMTHYEPQEAARKKDNAAIEAILKMDEDELLDRVHRLDITMCGYAPVIAMLAAAKELGAEKAKLVRYQTSGDTSGDYSSVVGYAGITVS